METIKAVDIRVHVCQQRMKSGEHVLEGGGDSSEEGSEGEHHACAHLVLLLQVELFAAFSSSPRPVILHLDRQLQELAETPRATCHKKEKGRCLERKIRLARSHPGTHRMPAQPRRRVARLELDGGGGSRRALQQAGTDRRPKITD